MSKPLSLHVIALAWPLVEDRKTWTTHALGRDARGDSCDPLDAKAVRWCAYGALMKAAFDLTGDKNQAHRLAAQAAAHMTGSKSPETAYMDIYAANDSGTRLAARKTLKAMFDRGLVTA